MDTQTCTCTHRQIQATTIPKGQNWPWVKKKLFTILLNLQINLFQPDLPKLDWRTGGKWLIHYTKHSKAPVTKPGKLLVHNNWSACCVVSWSMAGCWGAITQTGLSHHQEVNNMTGNRTTQCQDSFTMFTQGLPHHPWQHSTQSVSSPQATGHSDCIIITPSKRPQWLHHYHP